MRKSILRKGTTAFAAMLLSANVMAQSFDFTKEFYGDWGNLWETNITPSFVKDGNPRLVIGEWGGDSNEGSRTLLKKLSILDNNLNTEKEFTSGPLLDNLVDVTIKEAVSSMKLTSVETYSVFSGIWFIEHGFSSRELEIEDFIFDENEDFWNYFHNKYNKLGIYNFEDFIAYYEGRYLEIFENFKKEFLDYYVSVNMNRESIEYDGATVYFFKENVLKSDYFDWDLKYPIIGVLYRNHSDISFIWFEYESDEFSEVARDCDTLSVFSEGQIMYTDLITDTECSATISQNLFNDDDKYEFLIPIFELFEEDRYEGRNDNAYIIAYRHRQIGYKIVSEDGAVLHEFIVNETKDKDLYCYAYVVSLGDKNYLMVQSCRRVSEFVEVTRFYEIKKDGTGIQKVLEMRGSMNIHPAIANRDDQITITLNDDNSNVARELIITGANGQLVDCRTIPAGENTVKVSAAMMRSGMYNFTLQKKGEIVDNAKVIVR